MINGNLFFNLAQKWQEEGRNINVFHILQDVMDHYFGSIVGYTNKCMLCINGYYSIDEVSFVLDAVGYSNYSVKYQCKKMLITLRNTL